jgi:hypothetical protein
LVQRRAFEALLIPGSLHFDTPEELPAALDTDNEIIVCPRRRPLQTRYAGGLSD